MLQDCSYNVQICKNELKPLPGVELALLISLVFDFAFGVFGMKPVLDGSISCISMSWLL